MCYPEREVLEKQVVRECGLLESLGLARTSELKNKTKRT